MRTALRLSLVCLLFGALFAPAASSAAPARCASQWFDVYEIDIKVAKKVYRLKDSAAITATVTHEAAGAPVDDADIVIGALVRGGSHYENRASRTDARGVARVKIPLKRLTTGWVNLLGFARTYYNQGEAACAGVGLYGHEVSERAFRIER